MGGSGRVLRHRLTRLALVPGPLPTDSHRDRETGHDHQDGHHPGVRDAAALMIIKFDEQTLLTSLENPKETAATGIKDPSKATAQATTLGGTKSE